MTRPMSAVTAPLPDDVVAQLRALGSPTAEHLVDLRPHYEGGAHGRIVLPWCGGCGTAHWYPALLCPGCGGADWEWRDHGTRAHLDSWTVVHHPLAGALRGHLPLAVGLLVPAGAPHVRLVSALAVQTASDLAIDQEMDARPGPAVDGGRLLVFAPVGER